MRRNERREIAACNLDIVKVIRQVCIHLFLKFIIHTVKDRMSGSNNRSGDCNEAKVFENSGQMLSIMKTTPSFLEIVPGSKVRRDATVAH
jgi:hypothetical protein